MSFQYGSNSLQIPNPFKQEGFLSILSGASCAIIGLISLFTIRSQILAHGLSTGWINLLISLLLFGIGIRYVVTGLLEIFRFYVGRGTPASLAKNVAPSEVHLQEPELIYTAQALHQMLMGRKNPTFDEPTSLIDRLIYNIFPQLLFLPYPLKNSVHLLVGKAAYTVMFFVIYLFLILSSSIGLTKLTESSFTAWMGIFFIGVFVFLWKPTSLNINNIIKTKLETINQDSFVILMAISVFIPVIGEIALRKGVEIPSAPLNPLTYLSLVLILTTAAVASSMFIALKRAEMFDSSTDVSEYRNYWQENVHPKDIFICFDMEMTYLRYKDIPNRVYRELKPQLNMEGSLDKGSFKGDTIQETQPAYEEINYPEMYKKMLLYISIYGHGLICLSALCLFTFNLHANYGISLQQLIGSFYMPLIFWYFGMISVNFAHTCWAEIGFKSYLVLFQGEGTYTESKVSVGMSLTDSNRSENTVVRTSFTPWIIVAEILTSTFAGVGANNLAGARYILNMQKVDSFLADITKGIRTFLDSRQIIADTHSAKDLNSLSNFHSINQLSPANLKIKAIGLALADNQEK